MILRDGSRIETKKGWPGERTRDYLLLTRALGFQTSFRTSFVSNGTDLKCLLGVSWGKRLNDNRTVDLVWVCNAHGRIVAWTNLTCIGVAMRDTTYVHYRMRFHKGTFLGFTRWGPHGLCKTKTRASGSPGQFLESQPKLEERVRFFSHQSSQGTISMQ